MSRRVSYQSVLENHALKFQSMGKMDKILSDRMDALEKDVEKNQTTQLAEIKSDIAFLKDSLSNVATELSGVKGELSQAKAELSKVKGELSSVKDELSGVKADMVGVKDELDEVMKMYEEN